MRQANSERAAQRDPLKRWGCVRRQQIPPWHWPAV